MVKGRSSCEIIELEFNTAEPNLGETNQTRPNSSDPFNTETVVNICFVYTGTPGHQRRLVVYFQVFEHI